MKWPFLNSQLSPFPSRSNRLESVDLWRIFYLWLESKNFFDLIWVYRIEKLKSKCFVWLKPTSFVVLPQWESTFGITELVNPSRSFLKKNWEDHKKNQNPNRAVCFKTSIKLSSGLHLNISLFQVSRIFKNFDRKTKHHLKMLPLTLIAGWSVRLSLIKLIDRSKLSG